MVKCQLVSKNTYRTFCRGSFKSIQGQNARIWNSQQTWAVASIPWARRSAHLFISENFFLSVENIFNSLKFFRCSKDLYFPPENFSHGTEISKTDFHSDLEKLNFCNIPVQVRNDHFIWKNLCFKLEISVTFYDVRKFL